MAGKINDPRFPFYVDVDMPELQRMIQENPEIMDQWYKERMNEYREIAVSLAPGEPHPMAFAGGYQDLQYQAKMQGFVTERAVDSAIKANRPAPALPPIDYDFAALTSKYPEDRKMAKEILTIRDTVKRLRKDAETLRAMGDSKRAAELLAIAGGQERQVDVFRRKKYIAQVEADAELEKTALKDVGAIKKWSPEQRDQNREFIEGMLQALNHESKGQIFYHLNEKAEIVEIDLPPGHRCCDVYNSGAAQNFVEQRARLDEMAAAAKEKEESQPGPEDGLSQAEYEKQRMAEGAKLV